MVMLVEYNKRDLIATGGAVLIILIVFIPSILLHFHQVKDGSDQGASYKVVQQDDWYRDGQRTLLRNVRQKNVAGPAKNIIFFLGDGMGVSTLTAARTVRDQRREVGERRREVTRPGLSFETFPHLALVQTICADHLVADSACSSTAYMCGVKANKDTLGVRAGVKYEDCQAGLEEDQQVESLMTWAQRAGKLTGIVTTDRLTGASPAGSYAHSASRDWENDRETPAPCQETVPASTG